MNKQSRKLTIKARKKVSIAKMSLCSNSSNKAVFNN
ncbi:MAG: hypothetical protein UR87_C0005G0013 [candidate division CPR3 bacterium GW2011_GWE2_35_7]|uniref:Uncharacterized protein n=1 Tax=candidate division CPR3 bacterium GW2011_GWF2_35_18 TaxID=1618350 RepID=A0A0G0BJM7_UNCC3|nr:MAG: hypothetical protein UR67_C0004G0020 [candidate division CPR3 bacterium GW2011_GWF2_35_18]KKP87074.1 MAG: hypothetical protein UR87_C0005G0013 [candidate division CPR3 bacterium GW2011_GWE2_35_7]